MARVRQQTDFGDVPPHVRGYDPALQGPGDGGVDNWRDAARDWLAAHPGRVLPVGNYLNVLRECLALKMAEFGPWDD